MRLKIVLTILLVGALGFGVIFYLKQLNAPPVHPITANQPAPTNVEVKTSAPVEPKPLAPAMTAEQRQASIDAEITRLQDWQANNDPQSLSNILGDLTSPEKEIREAAIEAAKQFGSTNAIPVLKAIAANTQDPQEQIDLLEAANFLSLPSITAGGLHPLTPEQRNAQTQIVSHPRRIPRNPPAQ